MNKIYTSTRIGSAPRFVAAFVYFALFFLILNPYTIYGRPGVVVALLLVAYSFYKGLQGVLLKNVLYPLGILLLISLVGLMSSVFHGIMQFNHVVSVLSLIILALSAQGLWRICQRNFISTNEVLMLILLVALANALVIVLELNFDGFRAFIESYLDRLEVGSINYADGFRFRGIASSGGANLSLLIPVGATIALYLYKERAIGSVFLSIASLLLLFSGMVVGRTGLLLIVIPFIMYFTFAKNKLNLKTIISIVSIVAGLMISVILIRAYGLDFLTEKFGNGFLRYSFEFIFEGRKGIEDEGTIPLLIEFLQVLPENIIEILFGFGFYGGSDFSPWTDSGYARMFLSVGYFFGIIFYIIIFRLYLSVKNFDKFLIYSLICILAVAEIKEPLLFSGFASRIFMVIIVFITLARIQDANTSRHHRS